MEPARRARVPGTAKAVAGVTRRTERLGRQTRATGDPTAEAVRVAGRAAVKAPAKAGVGDLKPIFTI
ncbi:MAG: hypothetical protein PVI00_08715 [Desulfobacterales bacterium]|jgi:hypothetical protein